LLNHLNQTFEGRILGINVCCSGNKNNHNISFLELFNKLLIFMTITIKKFAKNIFIKTLFKLLKKLYTDDMVTCYANGIKL
jgi:hypothetical protein